MISFNLQYTNCVNKWKLSFHFHPFRHCHKFGLKPISTLIGLIINFCFVAKIKLCTRNDWSQHPSLCSLIHLMKTKPNLLNSCVSNWEVWIILKFDQNCLQNLDSAWLIDFPRNFQKFIDRASTSLIH